MRVYAYAYWADANNVNMLVQIYLCSRDALNSKQSITRTG